MEEGYPLQPGDVVQLDPAFHLGEANGFFGACFMTVTEPKLFGAQGFICMPQSRGEPPGHAYYRACWEEMEIVGQAVWVPADDASGEANQGEE